MSYTSTTELNLRKDNSDEAIINFRGVVNNNMDLIDAAYEQSLENVAAIEGSTASSAHSVGTYLVQNGILYLVTSAIAIGDTITPGTNVIATDLNTAVTSLNAAASNLTASLAAVEQTTATDNHAIGDYFMLGNVLMKATAAIATGEQISVSNATPATMQSQIDSLRDSVSLSNTTFSFDSSKAYSGGVEWIRKASNTVSVSLSVKMKSALNANTYATIGTVPSGYRPSDNVYLKWSTTGPNPITGYGWIESNGDVTLYNTSSNALAADKGVYCSIASYVM